MPSKYASRRALDRYQIYAIGFVAAEWSNLEVALMMALGELLGLTPLPAVALAGLFTNINASTDALIRVSRQLDQWGPIANELELMCNAVNILAGERNNIVHGSWDMNLYRNTQTGKFRLGHAATASGTGFPKRGTKPMKSFAFTAKEMREVAIASHEATQALLHLVWKKPRPLPDTPTLKRVVERQARRTGSQPSSQPKPSLG